MLFAAKPIAKTMLSLTFGLGLGVLSLLALTAGLLASRNKHKARAASLKNIVERQDIQLSKLKQQAALTERTLNTKAEQVKAHQALLDSWGISINELSKKDPDRKLHPDAIRLLQS